MSIGAMLLLAACLTADPPVVPAHQAGKHVGEEVTIEMVVASSRLLESGNFCFLNSKKSYTDKDNFVVALRAEAVDKLAERGVKDPATHFQGKTIRISGKVSLHQERPQILVSKPEQIVVVVKID